ncbi:MAG: tetratricopeptide repeat protein [Burkholderiaceae bacterium]|nr:tetratricopeptide repeat protein [Burkholderiaceae bacterium]
MRSAEVLLRLVLAAAVAAGAGGCALLFGPPIPPPAAPAVAPAVGASAVPAAPAPAAKEAPAAALSPAAPVEPPKPTEPALEASVLRAFETPRQALAAGRLAEAERQLLALAQAHPQLGGVHANLALVYRRTERLAESVAALERAVQASPRQPAYFNQLGIAYRLVGRFAEARAAYEQAIALDPNHAPAYLNLGILHDLYLWDGARALELYERYLALTPGGDEKVKRWVAEIRKREPARKLARGKEER